MPGDPGNKKNRLQPLKICTSDSRIFEYFPKGLTHDYGQKTEFFSLTVFAQKWPSNNVWGSFSSKRIVSRLYKYALQIVQF